MAFYQASDIPEMIAEFGEAIILGGVTVDGIVDRAGDESFPNDQAESFDASLVVCILTGSLPGLAAGEGISVDGEALVVRQFVPEDDGALTLIYCGAS